jgi:cystathionine beta-lyase
MKEKTLLFDNIIDRSKTHSFKWDLYEKDTLPLWVADMDFRSPQPIIDAIIHRAKHGIFGYTYYPPSYYEALIKWFKRRYDWEIKEEWLVFTPGVISAVNLSIQAFSNPGDKIIVQNPVYYPFYGAIQSNEREILQNPLKFVNGGYQMDFKDLEQKVKDSRAKLFILCNPHNPVGRVWDKRELKQLGEICIENEIIIVADEIHCDLIYPNCNFTSFASINDDFAQNSITCTSASKTFNLPGLQLSNIIIPNQQLYDDFKNSLKSVFLPEELGYLPNVLSVVALQAAFEKCEDWLDSLMGYIQENLNHLKSFIQSNLPEVNIIEPEGTYLVWLDFREFGMDDQKLESFLLEEAKVVLDGGYKFGQGGEGFQRINIACPRSILDDALNRIYSAIKNIEI